MAQYLVRLNQRAPHRLSGQLGAVNRTVLISGSGTDNTLVYSSDAWFRQQIADAMDYNQIGVSGIRAWKVGSQVNFEVEVLALAQHSDETVRQLVQRSVANRMYSYTPVGIGVVGAWVTGPQQRYILSNVSTRVVSGTPLEMAANGNPGNTRDNQNNQNNQNGLPPAAPWNLDLTSLGLGVLSGGTVAVLVVLFLALKR